MNELEKVEKWLKDNGIVYARIDDPFDWKNHHQIIVYKDDEFLWDVIWNRYSYGHEQGLLEMMWDGAEDNVEGWLTAEDVIEHAKNFDMLNGTDLCEEKHYWEKEQTVQEKLKDVVDWVNESPSRTLRIEMAPTGFILDAKLEVNYK